MAAVNKIDLGKYTKGLNDQQSITLAHILNMSYDELLTFVIRNLKENKPVITWK